MRLNRPQHDSLARDIDILVYGSLDGAAKHHVLKYLQWLYPTRDWTR
jgi:hypothetical protein